MSGELVVNPGAGTGAVEGGDGESSGPAPSTGGVLHLATETWSPLAAPGPVRGPSTSADTGYLGPAGAWVAAGVVLYEPVTGAWHMIPAGPEVGRDRTAVWTGQEIIAWGGTDEDYSGHLATGVADTPPAPRG